jgi:hypothetical protein
MVGRQEIHLSEWQLRISYLTVAARVRPDDRRHCETLLGRSWLETGERNRRVRDAA